MPKRIRRLSRTDVFEIIALAVLGPISWLMPQRLWVPLGRLLSVIIARVRPGVTRGRIATIERALGGRRLNASLPSLRVAITGTYMEERLQILRDYRPGGWQPRIDLLGREHLQRALAAGHGAVLWVCPFSYSDLVTKIGLHRAGFATSHLSAFSRGFSPNSCYAWTPTLFGMKVLSPIRTVVEDRYVRERIVAPLDGSLGYLRTLDARLRANGLVSIRAGEVGQRVLEMPFLAGTIRLASGAPSLALVAQAALLPVFTVRRENGDFDLIVEPDLAVGSTATRHAAIEERCRRYAVRLEAHVLRHPDLWSGWYVMRLDAPSREESTPEDARHARGA